MIYLAADHAGFFLKEQIKKYLEDLGLEIKDMGAFQLVPDDNYPDVVIPAAKKVAEHKENRGIFFGKSGQGEAIAANRVRGVRAAVYYGGDPEIITLSRQHNDTNVLSIGAQFVNLKQAEAAIRTWLQTDFEGGRHQERIAKIDAALS